MPFKFSATQTVSEAMDEARRHVAQTGSACDALDKKAESARRAFDEHIATREWTDSQVKAANDAKAGLLKANAEWLEASADDLRGELSSMFELRLDELDQAKTSFLAQVDLTADEVNRLSADALAAGDVATLRLLAAAAKRSGLSYRDPVPGLVDDLLEVYKTAGQYSISTFLGDARVTYAQNAGAIAETLDGQLAKAEARACVPATA